MYFCEAFKFSQTEFLMIETICVFSSPEIVNSIKSITYEILVYHISDTVVSQT